MSALQGKTPVDPEHKSLLTVVLEPLADRSNESRIGPSSTRAESIKRDPDAFESNNDIHPKMNNETVKM